MDKAVTEDQLRKYYQSCKLYLPENPQWRQWKFAKDGFFFIVPDRIYSETVLKKWLLKILPSHVYFSLSAWLDPTSIRQSFLAKAGYTTLSKCVISHNFVFDVDHAMLDDAKKITLEMIDFFKSKDLSFQTVYSGKKGFHIYLDFKFDIVENPKDREGVILDQKSFILNSLQERNIDFDNNISEDLRRIIRLPSSVHGGSGNICQFVNPKDIQDFTPTNIGAIV